MAEELGWVRPFVVLELPDLAGGKDCDDARPVLGLELFWAVDDDEARGADWVDGWDEAGQVEDVCARGVERVRGWCKDSTLEELLDVAHAEESRGRWRDQDNWVWSARWLGVYWQGAGVGCLWIGALAVCEGLSDLANVKEVLVLR